MNGGLAATKGTHRFERFGRYECTSSPLYRVLSFGVARDPDVLALATAARPEQPTPNMLFAAVHYLLLYGSPHPLRRFYGSITETPAPPDDAYPSFHDFCLAYADAIRPLLAERRVQTNEVRRCALLYPAFARAQALGGRQSLALIEVGTSGGLNLLPDRYAYDFGDGHRRGDAASSLLLATELRGEGRPPLLERFPSVASRVGLDLNPIDLADADAVRWLRALIWPEHLDRRARLDEAIAIFRAGPPPVLAGDALALLPDVLDSIPNDVTACVYHSMTTVQFSPTMRERFSALLAESGARRPLVRLGMEGDQDHGIMIRAYTYAGGEERESTLAECEPHGAWLRWAGE